MAFGIQPSGFITKQPSDIQADLQAAFKAAFGQEINLTSSSVFGQIVALLQNPLSELWQLAAAIYAASYPAGATGQSLDNLCQLTGVSRLQPTRSTVTATLNGSASTVVPAGTVFSVLNTGAQFQSIASVTLTGSPTPCACQSVNTGPVPAPAGTLVNINTPVAGLTSVTNAADAVLGTNLETDAALAIRRQALLSGSGKATLAAITSALLAVSGVTQATVFENTTDVTDVNGVPPHAINPVVLGGTDAAVAAAIFAAKAAGINSVGGASGGSSTTVAVLDSQGTYHNISFQRPTVVPWYLSVTVKTNPTTFPSGGASAIAAALYAAGLLIPVGGSAVVSQLYGPCFIAGVLDVTALTLGLAPSPVGTVNLVPTARQLLQLPLGNIVVTVT